MAKKQVDEQGAPWPPEEALVAYFRDYSEADVDDVCQLRGMTSYGCYFGRTLDNAYVQGYDIVPANEFTRQVIASWAASWAQEVQHQAFLGKLSADLRQFGVGVSVHSLGGMTPAERERLIAIVADGKLEDKDLLAAIQKAIKRARK